MVIFRAFFVGQRVHVVSDWRDLPIGLDGTVVRLRRSDPQAWVELDARHEHCPFPALDTRARHVMTSPDNCRLARLEPRDEPVWFALLAAADHRQRVDVESRGGFAAVLRAQGLAVRDGVDAADAIDRVALTGRVELDAYGLRVCSERVAQQGGGDGETEPRPRGCLCTWEFGDTACPAHPTCDECGLPTAPENQCECPPTAAR